MKRPHLAFPSPISRPHPTVPICKAAGRQRVRARLGADSLACKQTHHKPIGRVSRVSAGNVFASESHRKSYRNQSSGAL